MRMTCPTGGLGAAVLRTLSAELGGLRIEELLSAYEALWGIVPAGVTVVSSDGTVLFVNAWQAGVPGCPWVSRPDLNLRHDPALPRSLRDGLSHLLSAEVPAQPVCMRPFKFDPRTVPVETWLVPLSGARRVVGAVIVQRVSPSWTPLRPGSAGGSLQPAQPGRVAAVLDRDRLRTTFDLTRRELQVVESLCRGHGTADIATALGISAHTVKDHVKRIQRKMGARNRLTVVSIALRLSLQP